jgi:hypothetical protein
MHRHRWVIRNARSGLTFFNRMVRPPVHEPICAPQPPITTAPDLFMRDRAPALLYPSSPEARPQRHARRPEAVQGLDPQQEGPAGAPLVRPTEAIMRSAAARIRPEPKSRPPILAMRRRRSHGPVAPPPNALGKSRPPFGPKRNLQVEAHRRIGRTQHCCGKPAAEPEIAKRAKNLTRQALRGNRRLGCGRSSNFITFL